MEAQRWVVAEASESPGPSAFPSLTYLRLQLAHLLVNLLLLRLFLALGVGNTGDCDKKRSLQLLNTL